MGKLKFEKKYSCYNDCVPQGCPSHVATLEIQTVSDAFTFDTGKGYDHSVHYFTQDEMQVLYDLLHESDFRSLETD